jgi:alpha-beta hydrolase superfamily lysophospholipase
MKWLKRFAFTLLILFVCLNIVVAFHAYKFTHFYDANIVAVKKPEEMTGWEKVQAIAFGVNYPKKKIEYFPITPFSSFTVKTEDGFKLRGWRIPNKKKEKSSKGAVIMFHGHSGNKAGALNEAEAFVKLGYAVYMVDFRSHGESDGNICTIGVDESKDVKATYDFVKKDYGNKIILWGISLGAATITKAMADYESIKPDKVILEMPFASLMDAVKGRLRTMHLPEQPFATLLAFWGGTQQGFWAFSHNPSEYVKEISCPVLIQWGVHDARVSEREIKEINSNLASKEKQLVRFETAAHESLYKKEPEKWVRSVSSFLAK